MKNKSQLYGDGDDKGLIWTGCMVTTVAPHLTLILAPQGQSYARTPLLKVSPVLAGEIAVLTS